MGPDRRADPVGSAHAQSAFAVRLEWGLSGGAAIVTGADIAVVVDVLSFTTTLSIATSRGTRVHPFGWKDERAAAFAAACDASLAVGRFEGASLDQPLPSLSPARLLATEPVPRLVLPSPNGSAICAALRAVDPRLVIVGASLRNRQAVARWLTPRVIDGAVVAFVAAGEQWHDGSLRPGLEDLWGAGAVLDGLELSLDSTTSRDTVQTSPEAAHAVASYRILGDRVREALEQCASGQELIAVGFADDIAAAADLDADDVVPLLSEDGFVAAEQD